MQTKHTQCDNELLLFQFHANKQRQTLYQETEIEREIEKLLPFAEKRGKRIERVREAKTKRVKQNALMVLS